ncbi:unnamed protein product [Schistosoma haematobium]|nr:unnamed protein product [Schistosoma haematobium]
MGKDGPKQRDYVVAVIDAVKCPINITLFLICILLVYLSLRPLLRKKKSQKCEVPKMGKRDFTLEELQSFDGSGEHKRILIAVNGKIFDVTNKGQGFYGKGAPYAAFAGRDASRALACFNLETKNDYDDLSDLTADQMQTLREWELQFSDTQSTQAEDLVPTFVSTDAFLARQHRSLVLLRRSRLLRARRDRHTCTIPRSSQGTTARIQQVRNT